MNAPRDPDLDQAIDDLHYDVKRIRQIEQQLASIESAQNLRRSSQQQAELDDLRDRIAGRARQLKIPPRSLLLIVEQADRLKVTTRRRPTLAQLLATIKTAHDIADRENDESGAMLTIAKGRAADAAYRLSATSGAVRYLEDCRS